jgi:hypothetical protein
MMKGKTTSNKRFPALEPMDPSLWEYKNEGKRYMIFGFLGSASHPMHNHILRLYKDQCPLHMYPGESFPSDRIARTISYIECVERILPQYIPEFDGGVAVMVGGDFINSLATKSEKMRPPRRRGNSALSLVSRVGTVHEDHCPRDSLTVIIKPKMGFLPDCPLISPNSIKRTVSRLQMAQHRNHYLQLIEHLTDYDPLDLFSGDLERITRALNCLIAQPQSYFQVNQEIPDEQKLVTRVAECLLKSPVLSEILSLQRIDIWDIENMSRITILAGCPDWSSFVRDATVLSAIRDMVLHPQPLPQDPEECRALYNSITPDQAVVYTAAFLISMSANNCNIMITFPHGNLDANPIISVVDFDLKDTEVIPSFYVVKDQEILNYYQKSRSPQGRLPK